MACVQCRRRRTSGFNGYAFVANQEGRSLAAVDLSNFTLARQIPVEGRPAAVAAHPAKPVAYALMPENGLVCEVEASALRLGRKAQVARRALSMRLAPEGDSLWVLCREPAQLARLDLARFQIDLRLPLPAEPHDFDLSRDGDWAGVSLAGGGEVVFLDIRRRRTNPPVRTAGRISVLRFRSDGRQLLAGNAERRMLSILQVPAGRVVVHLPLPILPERFCFKADGGQLFVAGQGMDAVVVVYPYRTEIAETALAGKAPGYMAASSSPDYLFVGNPPTGDVTVMDIETRRAIAVVAVGEDPGYIAVTPDNQYALVLNQRSGNMAVIRIAAIVARRTKSAPLFTMVPVGSRPVSATVCAV